MLLGGKGVPLTESQGFDFQKMKSARIENRRRKDRKQKGKQELNRKQMCISKEQQRTEE